MLIDYHAHINLRAFHDDSDEVIKRSLDAGVWMINVGTQSTTSIRAVQMAEKYSEGVYAAVGIHPIHLSGDVHHFDEWEEEISVLSKGEVVDMNFYRKLAEHPKVVAIGEVGLDYYRLDGDVEFEKQKQKEVLQKFIALSEEIKKPIIFHCRDAYDDLLAMLPKNFPGVIHCFTGTMEEAKKILDHGLYIGFTGIVTFPKALNVQEAAKMVPLNRLMIETDCPYLSPQPVRGKRNEPQYVRYVAEKIAELKGISFEAVASSATKNSQSLFLDKISI